MSLKKKYRSMRLQKKILLSNLILLVLPCLCLTGFLFRLVQTGVNERLNHSKVIILNQINQNLEDVFRDIVTYTNFFYCNRDLNRLISRRSFQSLYEKLETENQIRNYFRQGRLIYNGSGYELRLLNQNGQNYASDESEASGYIYPRLNQLKKEKWFGRLHDDGSISYIPSNESPELERIQDGSVIHGIRLSRNLNSGRTIGLMEVGVGRKTFLKLFGKGVDMGVSKALLMDETGRIVFGTDEGLEGMSLAGQDYFKKLMGYDHGYFPIRAKKGVFQLCFVTNKTTGWKLMMYEPESSTAWGGNPVFSQILLVSIVFVLLAAIMSVYNSGYMSASLQKLKRDMRTVYKGDMSVRTSVEGMDEFGELGVQFNEMISKIGELIVKLEQEEEEKRRLEIKALQAQINPHFLYNTLASIRFLLEMDMTDKADESLLSLVKLLKRTYSDSRKLIPLEEELAALENYLVLMKNRYQDTFEWEIRLEPLVRECAVPKISIQPLVENSISHGFGEKEGLGHILVEAKAEGADLVIRVEDDGVGGDVFHIRRLIEGTEHNKEKEQFSAIGIRNVEERLKLIYGSDYGMTVAAAPLGGICLVIRIPRIKGEGEEWENADHNRGR